MHGKTQLAKFSNILALTKKTHQKWKIAEQATLRQSMKNAHVYMTTYCVHVYKITW